MTVVGIDVSKGKSMVAAMKPGGELVTTPYEVKHSDIELSRFALDVLCMEPDTRVVMEATGRYHEPVAALLHSEGIFVSVLNPLLIKQSGAGSLRKVKSDPKDALKIAKYGLDNWSTLREYTPMEAIRQQLKLCARQCDLYSKNIVMLTNNLISLSDKTFPGVNELFSSPEKENGHLKWVDFYRTFWHCDCINRMSPDAFEERYKKWCKRKGYHFSADAADALYAASCGLYTTLPRDNNAKLLVTVATDQLIALRENQSKLETEMLNLCKQLPEYETVRCPRPPATPCRPAQVEEPALTGGWRRKSQAPHQTKDRPKDPSAQHRSSRTLRRAILAPGRPLQPRPSFARPEHRPPSDPRQRPAPPRACRPLRSCVHPPDPNPSRQIHSERTGKPQLQPGRS